MILETFVVGALENNNFLLIDEVSKEAVLIDCSLELEGIKEKLDEYGANLKYILITHGHFDHILGLDEISKEFPQTPILAPSLDREMIEKVDVMVDMFVGFLNQVTVPNITKYIDENEELSIGAEKIKIVATPGHTEGGLCYFIDNKLFSGDTIFLESVGRTDLPGGSYEQLRNSVKKVLDMFDDSVEIFAGHGYSTTVGHEKQYNPIL